MYDIPVLHLLTESYRHLIHTFKWLREHQYIEKNGRTYRIKGKKLQQLIAEEIKK